MGRDLALIDELGLRLMLAVDTHAHADHVTAAWLLQQKTGCKIASATTIGAEYVDLPLADGQTFGVEGVCLRAIAPPGQDRNGVVQGKGGAVRGDYGGRR